MKTRRTRVALLVGGPSAEHDVSLASGRVVHTHLDKDKYEVVPITVSRKGHWPIDSAHLPDVADVAFVAMHGEYGEDGALQEVLRDVGIPYTGSDVMASALAMNKILASRVFRANGIRVPASIVAHRHGLSELELERISFPAVVKPSNRGSSVGVTLVRRIDDLIGAIDKALAFGSSALVEEFVPGRELTCAVIDDGLGHVFPLPVTEIRPRAGALFDYHSKYIPGASDEITPADLDEVLSGAVQAMAVRAHEAVGASGATRADIILGEDGELYLLEVNTIPGMTETSLLTRAALSHGISLSELFDRLIEAAFIKHRSI